MNGCEKPGEQYEIPLSRLRKSGILFVEAEKTASEAEKSFCQIRYVNKGCPEPTPNERIMDVQ